MMSPGFYLTKQVAKRFGISPDRVRQLEREGRLPAVKTVGGVRLFRVDTIELMAAAREREKQSRGGLTTTVA